MSELLFYDLKDTKGFALGLPAQISRELGRRIVSGTLHECQLIDDENKLCTRYHVSRSVIREAIKILVGKGLLEVRRGHGTRVKPRVDWNILDNDVLAWHQGLQLDAKFLRKLMDVRQMMEPNAAGWAAETGTPSQIKRIFDAKQSMKLATSVQAYVISDALFHRSILKASNNEFLFALDGVIFSALLGSINTTNSDLNNNVLSLPFHKKIYDAIFERNSKAAYAAMEEHLADTFKRLSETVPEFGVRNRK